MKDANKREGEGGFLSCLAAADQMISRVLAHIAFFPLPLSLHDHNVFFTSARKTIEEEEEESHLNYDMVVFSLICERRLTLINKRLFAQRARCVFTKLKAGDEKEDRISSSDNSTCARLRRCLARSKEFFPLPFCSRLKTRDRDRESETDPPFISQRREWS